MGTLGKVYAQTTPTLGGGLSWLLPLAGAKLQPVSRGGERG